MSDKQDFLDFQEFNQYNERYSFPESPKTVPARAEGLSGEDAAFAAAYALGQGATMGFTDEMAGAYAAVTGGDYTEARDKYREQLKKYKGKAPVISGLADVVGSMPSGMAAFKALGAPNTLLGSAAFGGAEATAQAVGRGDDPEEVVGNLIRGVPAAVGLGSAGYGVSEIYNRFKRGRKYTPGKRQEQAEELGIELTPAEKYGDQSLQRVEAAMKADPGYGQPFDEIASRNQERVNEIAAKTIDIDAKKLTEAEMGKAARNISKKFNDATASGDRVTFDEQWLDDLGELEGEYRKVWGKSGATPKIMNDILDTTEKGYITPTEYQRRYSQLGKDLEKAKKGGDKHKMELYGGLRDKLDSLVDRNFDGLSDQFREARTLYKNKMLLQQPGVTRTESGDVSPLTLANKLRKDTKGYLEGGNESDLYNVARVAQGTKSNIGDSGTATRSKGLIDHVVSPVTERLSRMYLSGKFGSSVLGGTTGKGGAINPFLNAIMQSPQALSAAMAELERNGLLPAGD